MTVQLCTEKTKENDTHIHFQNNYLVEILIPRVLLISKDVSVKK